MALEKRLVIVGRVPERGVELDVLLQDRGFQVYTVESQDELIDVVQFSQPDIGLIIGRPDLRIVSKLVAASEASAGSLIVILWPGVSVPDAVQLLDLGVDYVSGSYDADWLAAQLRALLRRSGRERAAPQVIELGTLRIDLQQRQVLVQSREVNLTPTEFAVLRVLAERPGTVLPSGEIMRQVMGVKIPESEAQDILKVHIHRLRHKIETDADQPRYIRTVRGHGYMYAFERRSRERAAPPVAETGEALRQGLRPD